MTRIRPLMRVGGIVICAVWMLLPTAAQAESLRTWPTAVVVGDQVRVGDLCELQGFDAAAYERVKETVVTPAPAPGGSRMVHLREVRDALAQSGVNLATVMIKGASRCAVSRPSTVPPEAIKAGQAGARDERGGDAELRTETLRQAVERFFQDELDRFGGKVHLQFGRTSEQVLDLSGPEFAFVVRRRSGRALGLVSIDVVVLRDGTTIQTVPMVVSASYTKPVVVARRAINAKATIRPDDVNVVEMTFGQVDRASLSDPAEVVGQRAKRFIPTGEMIRAQYFERVPLVRRGQIVDVRTRVGGVNIVTSAKAMQSGGFGDVIELRAMAQGKRMTIAGLVTGPRRVEIGRDGQELSGHAIRLAAGGG